MVEIVDPVGDRRMFGHDAGGIGHRSNSSAWFVQIVMDQTISRSAILSVTSIAISGTVGLGEPGLVFQARGHGAVADFVRVAEFVEIEQFGRQRLAARVALTFVLVDADFQLSGHRSVPFAVAAHCRARVLPVGILARRRGPAGAPRSYIILHSRRRCAVKSKVIDHDT